MAINKIPKNYYSDTNIRRDKINEIIDEVNDIASIPSPSAADAGKVVKVSEEGEYELADDAGTVLPSPTTADSGKVIKVSDQGSYELADDEGTVLPTPTTTDAGKVLTVDNNGAWELRNDTIIITATANASPHPTTLTFEKPINEIVADLVANTKHNCLIVGRFPSGSYNAPLDFVYHIDTYQEAKSGSITFYDSFTFHRLVKNFTASNKIQLEEFTLMGNDTSLSVNIDSFDLT